MLVLSRQRDQSIMIGDDIQITVVDVRGDKVRLGVAAPREVSVHRKEVYEAIAKENLDASQVRPGDVPGLGKPKAQPPAKQPAAPQQQPQQRPAGADPFLRAAIEEAKLGLSEGGLPIGSVLVRNNQIIARGHNRRVQQNDPMAHAEIDCLTKAGRQKSYKDTVLYSTLMPCHLCSGAVVQFGIPKVIVGESVNFPGGHRHGAAGVSSPEFLRSHGVEVVDLHDPECVEMMARFIREHPQLWNEDIGR